MPARWAWRSPTRSSTTPTCGWRWSTAGTPSAATGSRPTRSSACTSRRRSTASPRRCSAAAGVQDDGPEAGLHERADAAGDLRLLRAACSTGCWRPGRVELLRRLRLRRRPHVRLADLRAALRGAGDVPHRRRPLPRPRHPGGDAAAVRGRRRRARGPGQRRGRGSRRRRASTSSSARARPRPTRASGCSAQGVDPDAICWVRPRDPWMLNRALIQPDPVDLPRHGRRHCCEAAEGAASLDELFLRLEDAGIMLRIDRRVTPTMAKAPTLGTWELDLLRTHRARRPPRARRSRRAAAGSSSPTGRSRRRRRRGRALRGRRPEEPAARADLAARGDHPAAGPGRASRASAPR